MRTFGRRACGAGIILFALFGLAVMLLWNALLPAILGVGAIGYLQALGLLALCRILFGGLGIGPMFMARRHSMAGHWHSMSKEEREEFIRRRNPNFFRHMREHWCGPESRCGGRGRGHGNRSERSPEERFEDNGKTEPTETGQR